MSRWRSINRSRMGRKWWVVEEQEERLKLKVKLVICHFFPPHLISQDKQGVKQERRPPSQVEREWQRHIKAIPTVILGWRPESSSLRDVGGKEVD